MADDKRKHLIAGFIIALATFTAFQLVAPGWADLAAFFAAVLAGAIKEAHDATGRGRVEFLDFATTAFGGLPFLMGWIYG